MKYRSEIFILLVMVCIIWVGGSCKTQGRKGQVTFPAVAATMQPMIDSLIPECECPHKNWTASGNFIRYFWERSHYRIQVGIKGREIILPEKYPCPTRDVDIPSFYFEGSRYLVLIRGHGMTWRELTVCSLVGEEIVAVVFESQRDWLSNQDVLIYKIAPDDSTLYIRGVYDLNKDWDNEKWGKIETKVIKIPRAYRALEIERSFIDPDTMKLFFKDGQELELFFKDARKIKGNGR